MIVADIMTGGVQTCRPDSNLAEAARVMWENDCGSVPVVEAGTGAVVGIITDRDICMAVSTQNRLASEIVVGDAASTKVYTCFPETPVKEALALMQEKQVRRLPVVNGQGTLVGILSLHDVALNSKKGESKKEAHVAHKDVMATIKAISEPHHLEDTIDF